METRQSIPEAKLLLESLRSVGYSEEAAIADIIDNSISAFASEIYLTFDWTGKRIVITDNGIGMGRDELFSNMRIGSSDPDQPRHASDLGRFGMGMKTAAFSLGKKLIVISRKDNTNSNASWDLDQIPQIGWNLIVYNENELAGYSQLLTNENGTVLVIENLDRIISSQNEMKEKKHFFEMISKVEDHLSLVFHRFISEDSLAIYINGKKIEPWDPFITQNPATQELSDEIITSDDMAKEILVQPYVLPHKTKFASDDLYKSAGGPKGWNQHQGIYLYRNKRLILYGTWFGYIRKEPAFNLARIRVDISAGSDSDWKIDIKKSTASLPIYASDELKRIIDITTEKSAKVYNSRGAYSKNDTLSTNLDYIWEQRKTNGRYSFHINKKHTLLNAIKDKLDKEGSNLLDTFIALVENYAPFMQSGLVDSMQSSSIEDTSADDKIALEEAKKYIAVFKNKGFKKQEIRSTILGMPPYKHLEKQINALLEENQ